MYVPFLHLPLSFAFTGYKSKALFEANSAISPLPPVGDPYWPGLAPLAAYSAATTPGREYKCYGLMSLLLTWMLLAGRKPDLNHIHAAESGRVGVEFRVYCNGFLYDPSVVLQIWRRSGMGAPEHGADISETTT